MDVKKILSKLNSRKISLEEATEQLRHFPFKDLDFAKIDNHRQLRKGFPEVIYCANKTPNQILRIFRSMHSHKNPVLATRATPEIFSKLAPLCKELEYNILAKTIVCNPAKAKNKKQRNKFRKQILIISAGTSDIPIAEEAAVTAETFGHPTKRLYDVGVAGIHRLFKNKKHIDKANVLVVAAGMDGALPSVVSGLVSKPVIALPTSVGYGASFKGLSALLTMLNCCAPGVAVVNIDNGFGAGYLAAMLNK